MLGKKMEIDPTHIRPIKTPLVGFIGDTIKAEGSIMLPLTLGESPRSRTKMINFTLVKKSSAYNMILGRPSLYTFIILPFVYHSGVKFALQDGTAGQVWGD
ncbi:hypothetical protein ACH5RR_032876 [Cinchona calisaya]|uniref:Uncharacterized protein n=1 Tax=Cinchona calisaya TaxID=153742 RepID=A0ABD2YJB5_9GENT